MGLLDATLTGLALLVGTGLVVALAVSAWGSYLWWRFRRRARHVARLLDRPPRMGARGDGDRPAAAVPALPAGHAGLDGDASSSLADDLASRLIH